MSRWPKESSTRRGYGYQHQMQRKAWASRVDAGGVACRRCGEPIPPGSEWDLGHDDHDRSAPTRPEHRECNRATRTPGRPTARPSGAWLTDDQRYTGRDLVPPGTLSDDGRMVKSGGGWVARWVAELLPSGGDGK